MVVRAEVLIVIQVGRVILVNGLFCRAIHGRLLRTSRSGVVGDIIVPCIKRDRFRYVLIVFVLIINTGLGG